MPLAVQSAKFAGIETPIAAISAHRARMKVIYPQTDADEHRYLKLKEHLVFSG
jgi:hypothetical protein